VTVSSFSRQPGQETEHVEKLPDMERFSLHTFLSSLGPEELEHRNESTPLAAVARTLDGNPRAVLFNHPGGQGVPLCGNVAGSRSRLAHAFGVLPNNMLRETLTRLRNKPQLVEVSHDQAPVQQVVMSGEQCDLTQLPVHLQHSLDGAPYISASIDFARDPTTGWTNVGLRRLMLRGRRTAGIDLVAPSDLRAIHLAHAQRGERTPIAFAIGSHPLDQLAATLRFPMDELALMAALRGEPMAVVKCITNDLLVPADAQYIIEGFLDERGHAEAEGPYGEFLGYYGAVKKNPVFHVTAITHRRNPIFQTLTIGGRSMQHTDTAQLCALRTEVLVWRALEIAVREVRAVYASPATGGSFNVRIAMQQRVAGEARNAISAVFSCLGNVKNVFVVDSDIDVFSDTEMEWALATRFQADRDIVLLTGARAIPLDPSLDGASVTSKAGFDLTLPFLSPGRKRSIECMVPSPPDLQGKRFPSLEFALEDGPKRFEELMIAIGTEDGREVVRWLEDTRAKRNITRDVEGRYQFG